MLENVINWGNFKYVPTKKIKKKTNIVDRDAYKNAFGIDLVLSNNKSNKSGDVLECATAIVLSKKLHGSTIYKNNRKSDRVHNAFNELSEIEQLKWLTLVEKSVDEIIAAEKLDEYTDIIIYFCDQSLEDDQRDIVVKSNNDDICGISCKRNNTSNKSISWYALTTFDNFIVKYTNGSIIADVIDQNIIAGFYHRGIKFINHTTNIIDNIRRWPSTKKGYLQTPREKVILRNRINMLQLMTDYIHKMFVRYIEMSSNEEYDIRLLYNILNGIGKYDYYKVSTTNDKPNDVESINTHNTLNNYTAIKTPLIIPKSLNITMGYDKQNRVIIIYDFGGTNIMHMRLHTKSGRMLNSHMGIECVNETAKK